MNALALSSPAGCQSHCEVGRANNHPYVFGHSVLLSVAQWRQFRASLAVRVLDPAIKGHQNILVHEWLRPFVPPTWRRRVTA